LRPAVARVAGAISGRARWRPIPGPEEAVFSFIGAGSDVLPESKERGKHSAATRLLGAGTGAGRNRSRGIDSRGNSEHPVCLGEGSSDSACS